MAVKKGWRRTVEVRIQWMWRGKEKGKQDGERMGDSKKIYMDTHAHKSVVQLLQ